MMFLPQCCIVALLAVCHVSAQPYPTGQAFPTTLELDLVFPRNETYAPTDLLPIVFAFRHTALWPFLWPYLQWKIQRADEDTGDIPDGGFVDLSGYEFNSSADPFFYAADTFAPSNAPDNSVWWFDWSVGFLNCSTDPLSGLGVLSGQDGYTSSRVWFTIAYGGKAVDALALAVPDVGDGNGACRPYPNNTVTLNVTGMLSQGWSLPDAPNNGSTCPSFGPATPTASATARVSPCPTPIGTSAASSIASSLTAQACYPRNASYSGVCPPPPTASSPGARSMSSQSSRPWCGLGLAAMALVVGFLC